MSVKITRSVEKRNTSLRDFLLVATLPLLLVGALGYILGSSQRGDVMKNAAELAQMRTQRDKLKLEADNLNQYLGLVDSLKKELMAEVEKLSKERATAFAEPDNVLGFDPIEDWWKNVVEVKTNYNRQLKALEGKMEGERILSRPLIAIPAELFTDYNEASMETFNTFKKARERVGMTQNQYVKELEDIEAAHRDALSELKAKLDRGNIKSDALAEDKERLLMQLANNGKVDCPDNKASKAGIKASVNSIVAEIDGLDAKKGLLRWSRETQERIDEVKVEINKHSQAIRDQVAEVR